MSRLGRAAAWLRDQAIAAGNAYVPGMGTATDDVYAGAVRESGRQFAGGDAGGELAEAVGDELAGRYQDPETGVPAMVRDLGETSKRMVPVAVGLLTGNPIAAARGAVGFAAGAEEHGRGRPNPDNPRDDVHVAGDGQAGGAGPNPVVRFLDWLGDVFLGRVDG